MKICFFFLVGESFVCCCLILKGGKGFMIDGGREESSLSVCFCLLTLSRGFVKRGYFW